MRYIVVLVCLLIYNNVNAQNLISNGNFELYKNCPTNIVSSPKQFSDWCVDWYSFTKATPDYYNACNTQPQTAGIPLNGFGSQMPLSGNAYIGLIPYTVDKNDFWREYVYTNINPLQKGATYEISMSVSLGDRCTIGTDGLGVLFYINLSPDTTITTLLHYKPQISYNSYGIITDTVNWVRLSGTFVADSAYTHMMIGCFQDTSSIKKIKLNTGFMDESYYYIDSVVLNKLSRDTNMNAINYAKNLDFNIYPNPSKGKFAIKAFTNINNKEVSLDVVNILGQTIYHKTVKPVNGVLNEDIDISDRNNGVYIMKVMAGNDMVCMRLSVAR